MQSKNFKSKFLIIFIMGIFLISFASAVWWNPFTWFQDESKITIAKEGGWYLDHIDGIQLDNFDTSIENLDNGKAKICLLPKAKLSINDEIIKDSQATLRKNNIETKIIKPSDMESEKLGADIKKICLDVDANNEDYARFGSNSALFEYTNESITATNTEGNIIGKLSISTEDYFYRNGKPDIKVGVGRNILTHTFYIENYTSEAITNLKTINMRNGKEVPRNINIKYLTYEDIEILTYDYQEIQNQTGIFFIPYINGTKNISMKKWNTLTSAIEGEDYILGIFTDTYDGDYIDADFDYYGESIALSPINWATWEASLNTDLVAYYYYNNTLNSEIGSFTPTNNGVTFTTGILDEAGNFEDTENDFFYTTHILDTGSSETFSVVTWVNLESTPASNFKIINQDYDNTDRGFQVYIDSDGYLNWYSGNVGSCEYTGEVIGTGSWYMIGFSYFGNGTVRLVVNDEYFSCGSITPATDTDNPTYFGARQSEAGTNDFDGLMDMSGFWQKSLTDSEFTSLYGGGTPPYINESATASNLSIAFVTPPTPVNYFNTTSPNFTIQVNVTSTNVSFSNITYSLRNVNGTDYNITFTNETYTYNYTNIPEAHYHYDVEVCGIDDITANQTCAITETRHINHDLTPPTINITSPSGTYNYLIENYTLSLNWTAIDEALDSCWYTYNNITTYLNCSTNTTQFNYTQDKNNLTFFANDTFGNEANETQAWTYKVFEINQSYNTETIEGNLETFLATIKLGSGYSIAGAVLINYNGSEETGQSFASGGNTILRKANFLVPNVETDTNFTFYWNITLSDSTNLALSTKNQTVYMLELDNCSSYSNQLLNMSVVDEELQTILPNATIEIAVNIYDSSRTALVLNHSSIYENINPLGICLNTNLTENSMLSVDTIIRYEEDDHANEYYNIANLSLTNETQTQQITLYDLNLNDSTEFQLTFTGSDFLPVENALVYVDRQYISENTFKTVELPKTDYNGQTVLHLVRNDVIYNMRITKNGVVLGNFENLVAFCDDVTIGDCNIDLNAFDSTEAIFDYDSSLGITFTAPTYNATENKVTFNFVTSDGSSKEVLLEVTRNDIFGNRSVCNSSLTSSGGTLSCDVDPGIDETTLNTNVYVNDILSVKSSVDIDTTNYGEAGSLVAFVLTFSFILFFMKSKDGILISMGLSLASTIGLGLMSGNMIGLGASGVWLVIIIIIGLYKLNKDRAQ